MAHQQPHSGKSSVTADSDLTSKHTHTSHSSPTSRPHPTSKTSTLIGRPVAVSTSQPSTSTGHSTKARSSNSIAGSGPAATYLNLDHAVSQPSGLSEDSKKALISATVIGGLLILTLLFYVLWRRRKSKAYAELPCFGRHSDTITISPTEDGRITALPIYQENRYSVRSTRLGSNLSLNRSARKQSSAVAERFQKDNPWTRSMWRTANPPTPTNEQHPLTRVVTVSPSSPLKRPEMVKLHSGQTGKSRMSQNGSGDTTKTTKSAFDITIEESSPPQTGFPPAAPLASPNGGLDPHRSWTNTQAPQSPHTKAPSHTSSLSTLRKIKRVTSWVRGQGERQGPRIAEEGQAFPRRPFMPMLKNKASKPNLAPNTPQRKPSRTKRPDTGQSSVVRPSLDNNDGLSQPAPAFLADDPKSLERQSLCASFS